MTTSETATFEVGITDHSFADRTPPLPIGAWHASDYIASLEDDREIWCDGRRVDVTSDLSFRPMLETLANLYERQHTPELAPFMLDTSTECDAPVSVSYLAPTSREDLDRKWRNSHLWVEAAGGQLSRLPDFMANVVVGLYDYRDVLSTVDPRFGENAENYYRYCRDHDIALTHGLGDPQIDRTASPVDRPELGLRVVSRDDFGIVVRGAKQIATLAPYSHEVLIYLSPANYLREDPSFVCWFALPLSAPGLKTLCRKSLFDGGDGLGNRLDEQDAMLIFDDVFVPMSRVFLLDDATVAARGFHELNKWSLYTGQIRFLYRMRSLLGAASLQARAIGVDKFREIAAALGELTAYVEVIKMGLLAADAQSRTTQTGLLAPGPTAAMDALACDFSNRASAIIRQIGASGLVMQPSEADLACDELRPALETYMCGRDIGVDDKSRIFRLAADLVVDRFGMRQELYETWNRGNPALVRSMLYGKYSDLEYCEGLARSLMGGRGNSDS